MEWKQSRGAAAESAVPKDILHCIDPDVLSHCLSRFAIETRMKFCAEYLPASIYYFLAGIRRHMSAIIPNSPTFLDKGNKHHSALQ